MSGATGQARGLRIPRWGWGKERQERSGPDLTKGEGGNISTIRGTPELHEEPVPEAPLLRGPKSCESRRGHSQPCHGRTQTQAVLTRLFPFPPTPAQALRAQSLPAPAPARRGRGGNSRAKQAEVTGKCGPRRAGGQARPTGGCLSPGLRVRSVFPLASSGGSRDNGALA